MATRKARLKSAATRAAKGAKRWAAAAARGGSRLLKEAKKQAEARTASAVCATLLRGRA